MTNNMPLTEYQIKLAKGLLEHLLKNKYENISYLELAHAIGEMSARKVGDNVGPISKYCHSLGLPLISVKVVSRQFKKPKPSSGFYALYKSLGINSDLSEDEAIESQRKKVESCKNWKKLSEHLEKAIEDRTEV